MPLTLRIENHTTLPDGGPLAITVSGGRGLDIGRDAHLDWTLPDPERIVSSKHCEIRRRDNAYWLTDLSTNGTYLNGSDKRLTGPHRLRDGDRLAIGHYIVAVAITGEDQAMSSLPMGSGPFSPGTDDLWSPAGHDADAPIERALLKHRDAPQARGPDFLDWAVDVPPPAPERAAPPPPPVRPTPGRAAEDEGHQRPLAEDAGRPPSAHSFPGGVITGDLGASPWTTPSTPSPTEPVPSPQAEPRRPERGQDEWRPAPPAASGQDEALRRFAKGAGLPVEALAGSDSGDLMERAGALLALVAADLKQLLAARAETRRQLRSRGGTYVEAVGNNPLKFAPDATEALALMLGGPRPAYMPAEDAFREAFGDLKLHQIALFEAMREAIGQLAADLAPEAIEMELARDKRGRSILGNRKAEAWDVFATRWEAKAGRHENGLADAFLIDLVRCYDRYAAKRS
jgi:type VI secretion system protein ImpI